MKTLCFFN